MMMSRVALTVRAATTNDIPQLVRLMGEFYAESGYSLDREWADAAFRTLLLNPTLGGAWVASLSERIAGYVVSSVRYSMEDGALSAHIEDLFVRPELRRQGVGTALLDALVAASENRGCASLHVEVGRENRAATALYARYGLQTATDGRITLSAKLPEPINPSVPNSGLSPRPSSNPAPRPSSSPNSNPSSGSGH